MNEYLTDKEILRLSSMKGKKLCNINLYYWIDSSFSSLDWIEFVAEDGTNIFFTAGEISENIRVYGKDKFKQEIQKLKKEGKIRIERKDVSISENFKDLIGNEITNIQILDYRGYCDNSVIFTFKSHGDIEIYGGVDNINVQFDKTKIGLLYHPDTPTRKNVIKN
jgi:hypothetical protein